MVNRRISLLAALLLAVILGYAMRTVTTSTTDAHAQDADAAALRKEVADARGELAKLGPPTKAFSLISKIVRPSVVSIVTTRKMSVTSPRRPFGYDRDMPYRRRGEHLIQGLGSGVIVDREGHVLTNNHVVEDAEEITVVLADKTEIRGEVVGKDPKTDLAVVRMIDAPEGKLIVAELGDSDKLEVGDWVLAVGAPFGLSQSVSAGIVSALGRSDEEVIRNQMQYRDYIQTDAAVNRGNSGGPLVNTAAEVIGVNTAIATNNGAYQGVGFAIPSNMAKNVMQQLIKTGHVVRGYLGVYIEDVTERDVADLKLPQREGVIVTGVTEGTPAAEAGLEPKDVIVAVDGKPTARLTTLRSMIAEIAPGTKVAVTVIRKGEKKDFEIVVAEQPDAITPVALTDQELGITVQTLTVERGDEGDEAVKPEEGVLVVDVVRGSPAERAGIKRFDLIKQVANAPVKNVTEYSARRQGIDFKNKGVLLLVKSGDMVRLILVK